MRLRFFCDHDEVLRPFRDHDEVLSPFRDHDEILRLFRDLDEVCGYVSSVTVMKYIILTSFEITMSCMLLCLL